LATFLCPQPANIAAITSNPPNRNQGLRTSCGVDNNGCREGIMNNWHSGCVFKGVLIEKQYSGKV